MLEMPENDHAGQVLQAFLRINDGLATIIGELQSGKPVQADGERVLAWLGEMGPESPAADSAADSATRPAADGAAIGTGDADAMLSAQIVAQARRIAQQISDILRASAKSASADAAVADAGSFLREVAGQRAALVAQSAAAIEDLRLQVLRLAQMVGTSARGKQQALLAIEKAKLQR
jgi:hypothetical protein